MQIVTPTSSWEGWGGGATRSVKTAMYIVDIGIIDGHRDFVVAWEDQAGGVVINCLKEVLETYPRSESVYCRFFRSSKAN